MTVTGHYQATTAEETFSCSKEAITWNLLQSDLLTSGHSVQRNSGLLKNCEYLAVLSRLSDSHRFVGFIVLLVKLEITYRETVLSSTITWLCKMQQLIPCLGWPHVAEFTLQW